MNQPILDFSGKPVKKPARANEDGSPENTSLRDVIQDLMQAPKPGENPMTAPVIDNQLKRFKVGLECEHDYVEWDERTLEFVMECADRVWTPIVYGRVSEIFETARTGAKVAEPAGVPEGAEAG